MMLKDLVLANRSYRRFDETHRISYETLRELVELARMVPSTVNSQALKFRLVADPQECGKVFPSLGWAAALKDWDGPAEGERPSAYIIILCDLQLGQNKLQDDGITAQTMMLGAVEKGLGGCMLGNIRRDALAEALDIDQERYHIDLVLALGKPAETVKIVDVPESGSTIYYRDARGVHYVPKRSLDDLIVK